MSRSLLVMTIVTVLLIGAGLYMSFVWAPTESTMGDIQRIFYFHVGSFWTAAIAMMLNTLGCVMYIAKRDNFWDSLAASAAEVGVSFCSGVFIIGALWVKPLRGIWWTWDAR